MNMNIDMTYCANYCEYYKCERNFRYIKDNRGVFSCAEFEGTDFCPLKDKIKPCPFCGGEGWLRRTSDNKKRPYVACKFGEYKAPRCPMSHIVTWDYGDEDEAIEAWNRRFL